MKYFYCALLMALTTHATGQGLYTTYVTGGIGAGHQGEYRIYGSIISATQKNLTSNPGVNNWSAVDNGVWAFPIIYGIGQTTSAIKLHGPLSPKDKPDIMLPLISDPILVPYGLGVFIEKYMPGLHFGLWICDVNKDKPAKPVLRCKGTEYITDNRPPVIPVTCQVTNNINLQHFKLTRANFMGHKSHADVHVECNASNTAVSLTVAEGTAGRVRLNGVNGVCTDLTINGVGQGKPTKVTAGNMTRVPLESQLTNCGGTTDPGLSDYGDFSGSAIILLTFP